MVALWKGELGQGLQENIGSVPLVTASLAWLKLLLQVGRLRHRRGDSEFICTYARRRKRCTRTSNVNSLTGAHWLRSAQCAKLGSSPADSGVRMSIPPAMLATIARAVSCPRSPIPPWHAVTLSSHGGGRGASHQTTANPYKKKHTSRSIASTSAATKRRSLDSMCWLC